MKKVLTKVRIEDIGHDGAGLARVNGKVIFVQDALPGELVDIRILKNRKDFAKARATYHHEYAPERTGAFCKHFTMCGGCKWQDIKYPVQLKMKQKLIENAFRRVGKLEDLGTVDILGCEQIRHYRNKLEFTFSERRWLTKEEIDSGEELQMEGLGFHVSGHFDKVLDIDECWLMDPLANDIRNFIREYALEHGYAFYNILKREGYLRTMFVRQTTLGQWMLILVLGDDRKEKREQLLEAVIEKFPQLVSVNYVINTSSNDNIAPLEAICYKGADHIVEQLGHIKFRIGPKSFFQTNSRQAKNLYDVAKEFAGLSGSENVYDLYSGTGSIALYLADQAKHVVGIEQIPEAVEDAHKNKELNSIENTDFAVGDVKDILDKEFIDKYGKADVLITDPPRAGMHPDVVKYLEMSGIPRIVYVSCNPVTQARDLQMLSEKYKVVKMRAVDMFPHTYHIENVALLELSAQA